VIKPAAHGEFGFELSFTITAEELAESGLTANAAALFYVSDDGNISDCPKVIVNEDGSVTIAISKASYYYLSGESAENGGTTTTPSTTATTNTAAPANTNSDTTATTTTANTTKANSGNSDKNPGTGVTLCFTSVIIAGGALVVSKKKRQNK
jgi:hypothetical protein